MIFEKKTRLNMYSDFCRWFDNVFFFNSKKTIERVISKLDGSFQINCVGNLTFYLEMKVERNTAYLLLVKKNNINEILNLHDLSTSNPSRILLDPEYRTIIGVLLYFAVTTRPEKEVTT